MFSGNCTYAELLTAPLKMRQVWKSKTGYGPLSQIDTIRAVIDLLGEDGYSPKVVAAAVQGMYRACVAIRVNIDADHGPLSVRGHRCMGLVLSEDACRRGRVVSGITYDDDPGFVLTTTTYRRVYFIHDSPAVAARAMIERYIDHAFDLDAHVRRMTADVITPTRMNALVVGILRGVSTFPSSYARQLVRISDKLKPRNALTLMRAFGHYCRARPSGDQMPYQSILSDLIHSHKRYKK